MELSEMIAMAFAIASAIALIITAVEALRLLIRDEVPANLRSFVQTSATIQITISLAILGYFAFVTFG